MRTKNVNPTYPPIAQSARVQGVVIIEATIGTDGKVHGRQGAAFDSAARRGGARCRQAVGVHADDAQRGAGAGHHDGHGQLHAAIRRRSTQGSRFSDRVKTSTCGLRLCRTAIRWRVDRGFNGNVGSDGWVAKAVAFVLFFMSMWSFGVAIERIFTFTQARNQSKAYAPQVAKHLKEGRLKDAIAISSSKNYPLQPPREGRARRAAGIPVPAGKRRRL